MMKFSYFEQARYFLQNWERVGSQSIEEKILFWLMYYFNGVTFNFLLQKQEKRSLSGKLRWNTERVSPRPVSIYAQKGLSL